MLAVDRARDHGFRAQVRVHVVFDVGYRPGRADVGRQGHGDVGAFFGKNAKTFAAGEHHQQVGTIEGICADECVAREVCHRNDLARGTDCVRRFVQYAETLKPTHHAEDDEQHHENEGAPKQIGGAGVIGGGHYNGTAESCRSNIKKRVCAL